MFDMFTTYIYGIIYYFDNLLQNLNYRQLSYCNRKKYCTALYTQK